MLHVMQSRTRPTEDPVLRAMFVARKSVFIDLLKWDVPVIDGAYEIDQFGSRPSTWCKFGCGTGLH